MQVQNADYTTIATSRTKRSTRQAFLRFDSSNKENKEALPMK